MLSLLLLLLLGAVPAQSKAASLQQLLERYRAEPQNALLCEQIGIAYTQSQDFPHAVEFFRKSLALNPSSIRVSKNLATVLWFAGDKEASTHLFTALQKQVPDDVVPQLYLGLAAYEKHDLELAASHFSLAGALASDNPDVLPSVVSSYLATGRTQEAVKILQAQIAAGSAGAVAYRLLGDAHQSLNESAAAEQAYREAVEEGPLDDENYLALAGFYVDQDHLPAARAALANGLARNPESAKLTLEEGLLSALIGDFTAARVLFQKACALSPQWSLPMLALGMTDLEMGNAAAAAGMFRQARQVAPDDYRCPYFHALALTRLPSAGITTHRPEIIRELQHAIALAPAHPQPHVLLAQQYLDSGQPDAAEAQLRAAMRLDPNNSDAVYKLALLLRRKGNNAEASRLFATFASLKKNVQAQENEFHLLSEAIR